MTGRDDGRRALRPQTVLIREGRPDDSPGEPLNVPLVLASTFRAGATKLPGQQHLPPGLLRLSVGCEHVDDLWDDLLAAIPAQ